MEATITIKVKGKKLEFSANETKSGNSYWEMAKQQQAEVIIILQSMASALKTELQDNQKSN